jgi:thiol-disulfide isomerase/thioredoxin
VNWVSINKEGTPADIDELVVINQKGQRLSGPQLEGKVIFLNFWATWCPPCIAEMPSIAQLRQSYNDKVVFLLISDEDWIRVNEFKKSNAYNFEVYRALNIPKVLQPRALPKTFIVNRKGEIVVEKNGAVDWNSDKIRGLLDQLHQQ